MTFPRRAQTSAAPPFPAWHLGQGARLSPFLCGPPPPPSPQTKLPKLSQGAFLGGPSLTSLPVCGGGGEGKEGGSLPGPLLRHFARPSPQHDPRAPHTPPHPSTHVTPRPHARHRADERPRRALTFPSAPLRPPPPARGRPVAWPGWLGWGRGGGSLRWPLTGGGGWGQGSGRGERRAAVGGVSLRRSPSSKPFPHHHHHTHRHTRTSRLPLDACALRRNRGKGSEKKRPPGLPSVALFAHARCPSRRRFCDRILAASRNFRSRRDLTPDVSLLGGLGKSTSVRSVAVLRK